MRLYTFSSPSHHDLYYKHMQPSVPAGVELHAEVSTPQLCPAGVYNAPGWRAAMRDKTQFLLNAIKACQRDAVRWFFYSDVDVRWFGTTAAITQAVERVLTPGVCLAAQQDVAGRKMCAGMMAIAATDASTAVFEAVMSQLKGNTEGDDQEALNRLRLTFSWRFLPLSFACPGPLLVEKWKGTADDHWKGDAEMLALLCRRLPKGMLAFHANWCMGVSLKDRLLATVVDAYKV